MTGAKSEVGAAPVAELLDNVSDYVLAGEVDPAGPCVTFEGVTQTREEVIAASGSILTSLRELDIGEGDVVAVHLANGPDIIPALLAVWATGAAVAPLSTALGARDLQRSLVALRPSCVITGVEAGTIEGLIEDTAIVRAPGGHIQRKPSPGLAVNQVPGGTALVMHTSGTTGAPKAVLLPHSALIGALESVLRMLGVRQRPRGTAAGSPNLVVFPLAHVAGLYNVLLAFRNGRHLVLLRRFDVSAFLEAVERHTIRSVVLNPTMIQMLLEADVAPDRLRNLRFVRSGSAPLPPSIARRFWKLYGIPVLNGYGQTETAGEVIGWNATDFAQFREQKVGSVGRPHPGVSLMFLDEDGAPATHGAVGELCVRTPFAMNGYLTEVSEQKYTSNGYLRTGDLGFVDEDGFVWLVGRRSDVIVCGGFKVMPEEVEEVLREHPLVLDVMVAGVPDDRLGEAPHAFVVAHEPAPDDASALLIEHVRQTLSHYKAPRAVHMVGELPRNASGKLLRASAPDLVISTGHLSEGNPT